jgi:hypothetical protein
MMLCIACALIAGTLHAAQETDKRPIEVYPLHEIGAGIVLDGKADEPAWEKAPLAGDFTYLNGEPAPVQTCLRFMCDTANLYVHVRAEEPLVKRVKFQSLPRDSSEILKASSIEIFLDPNRESTVYHQIGIGAGGGVYDRECGPPEKAEGMGWTSGTQVGTYADENGWSLELAIPRVGLGLADMQRNHVLGVNVGRNRFLVKKEYMTWASLRRGFHEPQRFGCAVFAPSPDAFVELESEFRRGDRHGPLRLHIGEAARRAAYAALLDNKIAQVEAELKTFRRVVDEAENASVADKLKQTLADYERRLAEYRDIDTTGPDADPAALAEAEFALEQLRFALTSQGTVWDARLEWLLSEI